MKEHMVREKILSRINDSLRSEQCCQHVCQNMCLIQKQSIWREKPNRNGPLLLHLGDEPEWSH